MSCVKEVQGYCRVLVSSVERGHRSETREGVRQPKEVRTGPVLALLRVVKDRKGGCGLRGPPWGGSSQGVCVPG